MSDPISKFFDAWQHDSDDTRQNLITAAVAQNIEYSDPRTPEPITNIVALSEYVGIFAANAPGWTARVVGTDTIAGMTRANIAFGGPGPEGKDIVQLGQYFIEMEGDQIARMVGFPGTGTQE